jgi:ArsR family transcriptional regulator, arsenate/arsenite/antimonite-responsive transcriptional repressor
MKRQRTRFKPPGQHRHKPSPRLVEVMSPRLFKALCDPNRIALLARLSECGRPCGVTELGACCDVDLSVTSRHLASLREAGVIASTRRGKEIYYEVRAADLVRTLRAIADVLEECCSCAPAAAGASSLKQARQGNAKPAGSRNSPARKEGR